MSASSLEHSQFDINYTGSKFVTISAFLGDTIAGRSTYNILPQERIRLSSNGLSSD